MERGPGKVRRDFKNGLNRLGVFQTQQGRTDWPLAWLGRSQRPSGWTHRGDRIPPGSWVSLPGLTSSSPVLLSRARAWSIGSPSH